VLVLRFLEGLDVTATAQALGCRQGTVKSQTSHGLAALRTVLGGALDDLRRPGDGDAKDGGGAPWMSAG